MVRSTSIGRDLVPVAVVWHALALTPGEVSPQSQLLLAVLDVHSNVLAYGDETADPAAVAQEDKEKRVVGQADGVDCGSGQRQYHQREHVKGTARASGIADAAPATRSVSAKVAQLWERKGFASSTSAEYPSTVVNPDYVCLSLLTRVR